MGWLSYLPFELGLLVLLASPINQSAKSRVGSALRSPTRPLRGLIPFTLGLLNSVGVAYLGALLPMVGRVQDQSVEVNSFPHKTTKWLLYFDGSGRSLCNSYILAAIALRSAKRSATKSPKLTTLSRQDFYLLYLPR
ncbi:MAG: hypothetical protein AAFX78_05085 [Cyanobacteria bacterium J06638_20]